MGANNSGHAAGDRVRYLFADATRNLNGLLVAHGLAHRVRNLLCARPLFVSARGVGHFFSAAFLDHVAYSVVHSLGSLFRDHAANFVVHNAGHLFRNHVAYLVAHSLDAVLANHVADFVVHHAIHLF